MSIKVRGFLGPATRFRGVCANAKSFSRLLSIAVLEACYLTRLSFTYLRFALAQLLCDADNDINATESATRSYKMKVVFNHIRGVEVVLYTKFTVRSG